MKKNLSVLALSVLILSSSAAFATAMGGYDAGQMNSQYMMDIRSFDFRKENSKRAQQIETPKPVQRVDAGQLNSVSFVNNRVFSQKTLQSIVAEFIGKPITSATIMQMRKKIMKYYQSYGYYSAVAIVESENPADGIITFRMQEGSKDSIQIEGLD
ncbi:hypothetical protein IKQ26_06005 [bacterium]|nr:hypothetical protein [bacterium]